MSISTNSSDGVMENEETEDELKAIENLDFEKAMEIFEKKKEQQSTLSQTIDNYQLKFDETNNRFYNEYQEKVKQNEEKYEQECQKAKERLEKKIDQMAETQMAELKEVERRWRETRKIEKQKIQKSIDTLLTSSKLLARSHQFKEAIEMRDKAFQLKKKVKPPQIEECDQEFKGQFQQLLVRHQCAFDELISQYEAELNLLQSKLIADNEIAKAECDVSKSLNAVDIINNAFSEENESSAVVAVAQKFSPKSKKNGFAKISQSSFDSIGRRSAFDEYEIGE
ncbi:hypothetical protein GPJ56_009248 [Histomonas meleagridis]|uniref:uncharacterized protein n=1 Tax=Histomonas meleagridis TaxID=135588 RepID=UPI0035599C34|nr:hypothetical protein GPJ56_009248 [Histomonas meleagridis]KAH0801619.1 hypothetical protein GO595_005618 [Histomonas meleagridis]